MTTRIEPDYQRYQPKEGSLAIRLSEGRRRELFALFMDRFRPTVSDAVLDVGVTADRSYEMNNYFEVLYPHAHRITATGFDAHSDLPQRYPGLQYVQVGPGRMPFPDGAFDLVHCSAVIEHVGSRAEQVAFLSELWRVSRRGIFVTTPNRWFPVEFHTVVPVLHWLPAPVFRSCLRRLGRDFYADEANLNLLDRRALRTLASSAGLNNVRVHGVSLFGWESNLVLEAARSPLGEGHAAH
jgi:hypothetical protein